MEKGITAKQENTSLDLQAHIVESTRDNETLETLLENALNRIKHQREQLEKATKANSASRKNRPDEKG